MVSYFVGMDCIPKLSEAALSVVWAYPHYRGGLT